MKRMNGNPMLQLTGLRMLGHHRPLVTSANIGEQQNMLVQELERGERKKGAILHRHPSPTLSPSMAMEEKRLRPENSEQGNCKLALCAFAQGLTGDKSLDRRESLIFLLIPFDDWNLIIEQNESLDFGIFQ